jgi:hypothetical protein
MRTPTGRLGLAVVIIAIIGLILAVTVPWITYEVTVGGEYTEEYAVRGWYNYKMEKIGGDDEAPNKFFSGRLSAAGDYFEDSAGLSIIGFIFTTIMGGVLVYLGILSSTMPKFSKFFYHLSNGLIGCILLIFGISIMISGIRFTPIVDNRALLEEYMVEANILFPCAYIVIFLGFIISLISYVIIKNEFDMNRFKETSTLGGE